MFLTSNILAVTYENSWKMTLRRLSKWQKMKSAAARMARYVDRCDLQLRQRAPEGHEKMDIAGKKDAQKTEAVEGDRSIWIEFSGWRVLVGCLCVKPKEG